MEKKRKLPARAAARVEHGSKKGRTATPPDRRSATPASTATHTPAPEEQDQKPNPAQTLPKSVQPGKPLPAVVDTQPQVLSEKDYQSLQESGVLAESLSRSRHRWISDGLFEKYWSRPTKRRGVVHEEPNNPPKDSMTKVGSITITLEPHVFEATVFAVKDAKPPPTQPVFRPILQYGPSNGVMPPPPPPVSADAPAPTPPVSQPQPETQSQSQFAMSHQPQTKQDPGPSLAAQGTPKPALAAVPAIPKPVASPRGLESVLSPSMAGHGPAAPRASLSSTSPAAASTSTGAPLPSYPASVPNRHTVQSTGAPPPPRGPGAAPSPLARSTQPAGTDPIIVTLAEKATEDPQLRDLMKRVAQGNAPKDELERFQAIIDQITAETKRRGASQGPSADRLFVDGRTVRYFADEVTTILDIVLKSNPRESSAKLRPPAGSDPLIVSLVRAALDDAKTRDIVRRIAGNTPQFSDAIDLKAILERLKNQPAGERSQKAQLLASPAGVSKANGSSTTQRIPPTNNVQMQQSAPQQALRSKAPPTPVKPDVSAIVFDFAGGNGDRYLFPKFSILEPLQTPQGGQLVASFLIVRKGSTSEYGGDPKLDYYQPVTIRLSSPHSKCLEYLPRVVAPPDEVNRYMNNIMDNMTRAEYVLLAMRLPRGEMGTKEEAQNLEKDKTEESNGHASEAEVPQRWQYAGLSWKAGNGKGVKMPNAKLPSLKGSGRRGICEDEQYQNFIANVTPKTAEDEA